MPASLTLLCLPCAGASATMYLRWRRVLPRWIEIVPVELPGRGARLGEPFAIGFDAMVDLLCREQGHVMQGQFALLGHSMGALLAYGMAHRLMGAGQDLPAALIVSGSAAPARRDGSRLALENDDEGLIADLRKQGGTPEEVLADEELLRITLDVLGADYRVCKSFQYARKPRLPVPIHVWAGRDDDIGAEHVYAWAEEAGRGMSLDWFDGGHFFIRQQEERVLAALSRLLESLVVEVGNVPRALA